MSILTFDLETTIERSKKRAANPFDPDNYIVAIGWKYDNGPCEYTYFDKPHRTPVLPDLTNVTMLIGFNIKFDLLYTWWEKELTEFFKRGGVIYDGQYMEYLLSGMVQESHMLSMNEVAARYYEGGGKLDAVKEMWEQGICTKDIPKDLLIDYLVGDGGEIIGDIENTYRIFCHQVKRAKEEMHPNFVQMFKHRMDGLLATTEMEWNGMFVNMEVALREREQVVEDLAIATAELENYIPELPPELTFNWNSNVHKSALIFGGTVKYQKWTAHEDEEGNPIYAKKKETWPLFQGEATDPVCCTLRTHKSYGEVYTQVVDGKIRMQDITKGGKNAGRPKTKQVSVPDTTKPKGAKKDYYFRFSGYTKPLAKWKGEQTDAYDDPIYSTAAGVIEELATRKIPFLDALVKRTALAKDLGTYYYEEDAKGRRKGMLTLVGDDGIIHHKLNHTSTVTSRMSSSDPNLQNIPRGDTSRVKVMLESRFGRNGRMAEIDYSQLEVVVQGLLSRDPQLIKDLNDKVDFHCKRLSAKLNEDYQHVWNMCHVEEDTEYGTGRTNAKRFSFQRAYGAGAPAIAASTGMSVEEVKELIEAEEKLYPGVVEFDKQLEKTIQANRIPSGNKLYVDGVQFSQGEGHWDSPTGTRYIWREGITPEFLHEKGKFTGFSPTERKNYPVQGTGGEIVQTMLGKVFRYFIQNDRFNGKVLLVNTVHDCVLLDGEDGLLQPVAKNVQKILEAVPQVYEKAFGIDVPVPFPCETEVGHNLYDMEVLH